MEQHLKSSSKSPGESRMGADQSAFYRGTKSLATDLVNTLGRDIVSGDFPEGTLLPNEAKMLETYGVSRTALREAYGKLTAKGLISARPRVGTSVRQRTNWNMLDPEVLFWHLQTVPAAEIAADLYALRRMVEPGAAEIAASLRSDEDMARIDMAFQAMEQSATERRALVDADFNFHLSILVATRNPFINAFSALIRAAMVSTFELSWQGAEVIKHQRLQQHADVANAIRQQEPEKARALMERLLDDSITDVSEALT